MKTHVKNLLEKNVRIDGRKLDELRKISVEYGITPSAEGSARVKIGDTEVVAGVKMGIEKPIRDLADKVAVGELGNVTAKKCFRNINPIYCQNKKKRI